MTEANLVFPDKLEDAVSHAISFMCELNERYSIQPDLDGVPLDVALSCARLDSAKFDQIKTSVEAFLNSRDLAPARASIYEPDVIPYRLVLFAYELPQALSHEPSFEVLLENYEILLSKLAGKFVETNDIWEKYFWPK